MHMLKQGMAAVALVASLGLIVPASFGGPVSADISREWGVQPMSIECDLDGNTSYEYTSEVTSADHDPGGKVATLQDVNSSLVFVPQSGSVTTIFTAIENNEDWPEVDDSDPAAAVPLASGDPRLAGGYPASFVTPPGYPFSYFGEGFSRGNTDRKQNLVDCVVIDVGKANPGTECLRDGVLQDVCSENAPWVAGAEDVENSKPCLVGSNPQYDKCMAFGVSYHYEDIFTIKAVVSGNSGASVQAASADDGGTLSAARAADDGKHRADRKHKAKNGGKHRGNGRHRR
jgi:hypothetical protein